MRKHKPLTSKQTSAPQAGKLESRIARLKIFTDGGARGNPGPGAGAFVALDENGGIIKQSGIFLGDTTNNQAEYNGVLLAFEFLKLSSEKLEEVNFFLDSELITNQLLGKYKIKDLKLQTLAAQIKEMERSLGARINYQHIPRSQNKLADLMVNKTIDMGLSK